MCKWKRSSNKNNITSEKRKQNHTQRNTMIKMNGCCLFYKWQQICMPVMQPSIYFHVYIPLWDIYKKKETKEPLITTQILSYLIWFGLTRPSSDTTVLKYFEKIMYNHKIHSKNDFIFLQWSMSHCSYCNSC